MCGRFTQTQGAEAIATQFAVADVPAQSPRYNIAPTQLVATIIQPRTDSGNSGSEARQFRWLQWGLIPSWAKDPTMGAKLINARAETVAEKPSFRTAFRQRRCLVIADGFYEWQQRPGKTKQPFYFRLAEQGLFAFAGLWEQWQGTEGQAIASCTILTTTANPLLQPIHERMPVILEPRNYETWLDPTLSDPAQLQPLLQPYSEAAMATYPVSSQVNRPTYDHPDCLQPLAEGLA